MTFRENYSREETRVFCVGRNWFKVHLVALAESTVLELVFTKQHARCSLLPLLLFTLFLLPLLFTLLLSLLLLLLPPPPSSSRPSYNRTG